MINKRLYKVFMLITKYLMFFVSILYFITTLITFWGFDNKYMLLFVKVPAWIVLYGIMLSKVLKFCLIHRLPMYYMLSCNILFIVRVYFPIDDFIYLCIAQGVFLLYITTLLVLSDKNTPCSLLGLRRKINKKD